MPSVQLFAYDIDTHNQDKINEILKAKGQDPTGLTEGEYFTLQANLQRDLIRTQVQPHVTDGVLPVFLAPEFFFKTAKNMPFSRATFFNMLPYLESISDSFPDVLWVLGTVWWAEPHNDTQVRVHNSALILQNGRLLHSWQKERLSGIDGLRQGPEVWDRHDQASARILEETQDPFFTAVVPGGSALSCGVEICLDHLTLSDPTRYGVLRDKYLAAHPEGVGAGVDLHILTAAGMPIQAENIASRTEGVFVRCDGGAGQKPRSNAIGITRAGGTPAAALRNWTPTQTPAGVRTTNGEDVNNRVTTYNPVAVTP